jgi:hypothetical protein
MSGLTSLHKILKDETRQKIILLLNEKGSLGYTELMDATQIGSTGLLNYHLKVLGSLITKTESGHYVLTEKGKLSSRLLVEFPEENQQQKRIRQKRFWTIAAYVQIISIVAILALYFTDSLSLARTISYSVWFVGCIFLAYLGNKLMSNPIPHGSERERQRFKKAYTALGALVSFALAFFGTGVLSLLSLYSRGPNIISLAEHHAFEYVTILFLSVVLGSFVGYYFGRMNSFQQPKWAKWLEDHYGII